MEKKWRKLIESLRRQEKQQGGKKEPDVSKLIILFLAGVFLLLLSLPTGSLSEKKDSTQKGTDKKRSQSTVQETAVSAMEEYAGKQERELEKVLSKVKGIGDVDEMVTIASSEEKRTLKQEDSSNSSTNESDSTGGSRTQSESSTKTEPVLVGEEGKEPYIIQIASPQIEGVLVVAQGAGSGAMDSEIIAAVEALFPIESHKIKVMKMR